MQFYFIKKDDCYLHITQSNIYQYQDYCDIDTMYQMKFEFLKTKENAKKFQNITEAQSFFAKKKRHLKGAKIERENLH